VRRVAVIAAAIAIIDQLTKLLVLRFLAANESRAVIDGFFSLVNVRNTGAAFSMFPDSNLLLTVVCVLTILALYTFRHSFGLHLAGCQIAFGLIVGGITGNLIDRLWHQHVVDFLDFYIGTHHWPAFNVADSAICIGVALYIFVSWRNERQQPVSQPS
jgi:signal peptidase II